MENKTRLDLMNVWKNQPVEPMRISTGDLRRKAHALQYRVFSRNLREYFACMFVVACFGYYISVFTTPLARIGCGLVIAGTLFVAYTLHHRGSSRTLPEEAGLNTYLDFHRRELERQRDLLRSVWTWYLLPFVPGVIVFLLGLFQGAMQLPGAQAHAVRFAIGIGLTFLLCAVVFIAIGALNQWAAGKLQGEIDALEALGKES